MPGAAVRYRVIGADGREVGVYASTELHAFKAQAIRSVDDGVIEAEVYTVEPVDARGRPAGTSKRWSAPHGLASHENHTEPKAKART